jgi:hypothetical protein
VLDLVPFRRPWRIMADVERQSRLVGQASAIGLSTAEPAAGRPGRGTSGKARRLAVSGGTRS